uniref:Transmembrane protein n=1 Tax=Lactuca sativa TaxID=4236 RepID=A0A9R1W9T5_LACSA|nr:hypothetical protein LSAT_V11C200068670 [Lactuca sativa]
MTNTNKSLSDARHSISNCNLRCSKEFEFELKKEYVRNLNPIPYVVWLAGNGIGINSRICLVGKKWNWNSLVAMVVGAVAVVAATIKGGGNGGCDNGVVKVSVTLIVVAEVVVIVAVLDGGENDDDYGVGGGSDSWWRWRWW